MSDEGEYPLVSAQTPQIVMKFTLPQDREWFEASYHGLDWRSVVEEVDEQLRSWLKYGHNFDTVDDALEELRSYLHGLMSDFGIDLF